ncbi:MAG: CoA transferase, partial [Candidatus Obscuribacterales bacterium]|nr:CoA transferase [Candidatus Obscuribacterales bacterium]
YYWALNKRKKRLVINLKDQRGTEIIDRLVVGHDIVIENFRPGVMNRLSLGYERLKELNPALIYCSISGYGQESKEANRPAHDLNLVAETGVLNLNRRHGERPVIPAIPISDYMSGLLAALSVVASLYKSRSTSIGEHLDISMLDSALSSLNILASMTMYMTNEPDDGGFIYPKEMPDYNVYECKGGGYLAVAALEDRFWEKFCQIIERPELINARNQKENDSHLTETIQTVIAAKTRQQWIEAFTDSDCCVSPVNTLKEALVQFPLSERAMLDEIRHPVLGKIEQVVFPVDKKQRRLDKQPLIVNGYNDVQSLLVNAGYCKDEIDTLVLGKVISHQHSD